MIFINDEHLKSEEEKEEERLREIFVENLEKRRIELKSKVYSERVEFKEQRIRLSIEALNRNIKNFIKFQEIENIQSLKLIDIALEKITSPNEYDDIYVFTHHFSIVIPNKKAKYMNVLTFHNEKIHEFTDTIFFPLDYQINYTKNEIEIKTKYELEFEEILIKQLLERTFYYNDFNKNYKDDIIKTFKSMGYEIKEI